MDFFAVLIAQGLIHRAAVLDRELEEQIEVILIRNGVPLHTRDLIHTIIGEKVEAGQVRALAEQVIEDAGFVIEVIDL